MTETAERPDLEKGQPEARMQTDYFGFQDFDEFYFPDGVTWVKFKVLNEGERSEFERQTQSDFVVERTSGNTRVKMNAARVRHALIQTAVVDWNLVRGGALVPFSDRALKDFLKLANPKIVSDLETAIRKKNPFLVTDMTVEDIDKQIEDLQEQRRILVERDQGE